MLYYHPVFDRAYAAGSAYDGYCIPTHRCGKLTNRVRRGADSHRDACVGQLAEQLTRNEQVAGSNPATSSKSDRILLNTVTFITFQRICNE